MFNFSESLNTISGSSDFASLPSRNMGISGRFSYNYDARYFTEFNLVFYWGNTKLNLIVYWENIRLV